MTFWCLGIGSTLIRTHDAKKRSYTKISFGVQEHGHASINQRAALSRSIAKSELHTRGNISPLHTAHTTITRFSHGSLKMVFVKI